MPTEPPKDEDIALLRGILSSLHKLLWKLHVFRRLFFTNPLFNYVEFFKKIDKEKYHQCRGYISLQMYGQRALKQSLSICNRLDMKPFLLYGTLLGCYRDKGFIPHDSDIDFGLLKRDFPKIDRLREAMIKKGYVLRFESKYGISFGKPRFRGLNIDFFLIREEDGQISCSAGIKERWATRYYPKDIFSDLVEIKFLNEIKTFVPARSKQYLTLTYGNWKNPVIDYKKMTNNPPGKIVFVNSSNE